MKNMKINAEILLAKAYRDCQRYQSLPFKALRLGELKNTHVWTRLEALCEVLGVDACWFYEKLTKIPCECSPETKVKALSMVTRIEKDE